jgi:hypothetical protein
VTRLYFTLVKGDTLTIDTFDWFVLDVNPTGGTLEVVEEQQKEADSRVIKLSFGEPRYFQTPRGEWTLRGYSVTKEAAIGLAVIIQGAADKVIFLPKRTL